jgi:hypothetical protein
MTVDYSELLMLEKDLGAVPALAVKAVFAAVDASGDALAEEWAGNVRETGGTHLPWLPDAITSSRLVGTGFGDVAAEVGPEVGKKQGALGKGDEYGSVNTPAHMNGHRAADVIDPRFERSLDAALAFSMTPVTRG